MKAKHSNRIIVDKSGNIDEYKDEQYVFDI